MVRWSSVKMVWKRRGVKKTGKTKWTCKIFTVIPTNMFSKCTVCSCFPGLRRKLYLYTFLVWKYISSWKVWVVRFTCFSKRLGQIFALNACELDFFDTLGGYTSKKPMVITSLLAMIGLINALLTTCFSCQNVPCPNGTYNPQPVLYICLLGPCWDALTKKMKDLLWIEYMTKGTISLIQTGDEKALEEHRQRLRQGQRLRRKAKFKTAESHDGWTAWPNSQSHANTSFLGCE